MSAKIINIYGAPGVGKSTTAAGLFYEMKKKGLKVARRSRGDMIAPDTDFYLADTIGEMGLLYQLAPIVFVGESLIKFGGQNMLEPMYWGKVVFVGPYAFNFRAFMTEGKKQKALYRPVGGF